MTRTATRRMEDLAPAQQAGILCNDPRFQSFAAMRCGFQDGQFSTGAAAQYLRECCQISTRRELDISPTARARFQTLRTEFDAWTGKLAAQR